MKIKKLTVIIPCFACAMIVFGAFFVHSTSAISAGCSSGYESALSAINGAPIGQGLKSKLLAHVNNAWRTYNSGKRNSKQIALQQLDVALRLIDSPSNRAVPPQTKDQLHSTIQSLRNCIESSAPVEMATLTVRVFLPSDIAPNGILGPAPAGVIINIDDVEFGTTDANGTATIQVPARTIVVEARLYPSSIGESTVTLIRGEMKTTEIILQDGKEISEDSSLTIDQLNDGVLDRNFSALVLRFTKDDGTTVAIQRVYQVSLLNPQGSALTDVLQMFTLQPNGTLALNNIAGFRALLLARLGKILLNVHAEDGGGRVYDQTVEFYLSAYRVSGRFFAPPSNSSLNTTGIFITGKILNTDIVLNAVSDGVGNFEFPLLPAGNFEFYSETLQNGSYYYGQGILVLNGNKSLSVNLLSTTDLINGVPPFTITSLAASAAAEAQVIEEQIQTQDESATTKRRELAAKSAISGRTTLFESLTTVEITPVSVSVTAAAQNVPVTQIKTLEVPQGTKTVDFTYKVYTAEYPYYVLSQSVYNDTWSISVKGGASGKQLFNISRQINSQLSVTPVWQSDGSTGEIKQSINIESLTASGPTTLTLFVSAMNVGDSILATSVNATLGGGSKVTINEILADTSVPLNFHSIPRPGATNTFERFFTLKIAKPEQSTVKRLIVTMSWPPGSQVAVLDQAPGDAVKVVDKETIEVKVHFNPTPSPINTDPPPTHFFIYRFRLVVDDNGEEVFDEKGSGERRGLWRMPNGFARYGARNLPVPGGDDWCSLRTYNWLNDNRLLITRIDDISGEHGRYYGHAEHLHGTDIDMFHCYTFPGGEVSAGENYNKLRANVVLAASTDPTKQTQAQVAKGHVISWITATHTRLDALAFDPVVGRLIYANGAAGMGLSDGWAKALLTTGKTMVGGTLLDLGTGSWSNPKFKANNQHNSHIHIDLDFAEQ